MHPRKTSATREDIAHRLVPSHSPPSLTVIRLTCVAFTALVLTGPARAAAPLDALWPFEAIEPALGGETFHYLKRANAHAYALAARELRIVTATGEDASLATEAVHVELEGAEASARLEPGEQLSGYSHYLLGTLEDGHVTKLPHFATLNARSVYPGVDVSYRATRSGLAPAFAVSDPAALESIRWRFSGTKSLELDKHGQLNLTLDGGTLIFRRPDCYQDIDGQRVERACNFALGDELATGFSVGKWDSRYVLHIRPAIDYAAFIGGGGNETGEDIAVDDEGSAYVAGTTLSIASILPTSPRSAQPGPGGGTTDAFAVKLGNQGTAIVYATFIGGESTDRGFAIAVDDLRRAYVAGETFSAYFPTTPGVVQRHNAGRFDAFVVRLDADGTGFEYATFLGGNGNGLGDDSARALVVDAHHRAHVAGSTGSGDFPVTGDAVQVSKGTFGDAFVAILSDDASGIEYATFLGGNGSDRAHAIALDRTGAVYVGGETTSQQFPTSSGAFQENYPGGVSSGFVAKLANGGAPLRYATYVGGTGSTRISGLDVTARGRAYVAGVSFGGFPATDGVVQPVAMGDGDGFVAALGADGDRLVFASYMGGSGLDEANDVALDSEGNAYVVGRTRSLDFPVFAPALSTCQGGGLVRACEDAFLVKLDRSGSRLATATFLGGVLADTARAVAVSRDDEAYLTGRGGSDFPTTPGALALGQGFVYSGLFVVKLGNRSGSDCRLKMRNTTYGDGETVVLDGVEVHNPALEDAAFEVKVFHLAPDGTLTGLANQGGDGALIVAARDHTDLGAFVPFVVTAATPRGGHRFGCVVRDPRTGAALASNRIDFEVQ